MREIASFGGRVDGLVPAAVAERFRELFPAQTAKVSSDELYLAVNAVRPTLIRVDADEVTYNMHIMVRFELELALIPPDPNDNRNVFLEVRAGTGGAEEEDRTKLLHRVWGCAGGIARRCQR